MLCHDHPHGSSPEVMAAKASHQQGRLRSDQDTHLPGSPSRPRAPGQIPTVSRSQGSAHSSHTPPPQGLISAAVPILPTLARATAFLPQLGKGSDLAAAYTSCVPNHSYKREKSSAEKYGSPFYRRVWDLFHSS